VYSAKSVSLAAFAGQTVRIQFRSTTDSSYITTFRVDSVSTISSTTNGFGTIEPPSTTCGGVDQPPCPPCDDQSVCGGLCGDTSSDVNNCGACGNVCDAGAICQAGACVFACTIGHTDCDGLAENGCETDISGDAGNCGACGDICLLPFALPTCQAGECRVGFCIAGHSDCDGNPANGCEVGGACPTCPAGLVVASGQQWYETSPGVPLAAAGTVRASLTFQRGAGMTFPEVPLQVWSVPSIIEPPYVVSIQLDPTGATFTLAVSVDVHGLPAGETKLAFRPVSNELGTMSPAAAPLVSSSFACGGGQ
jgi:hypothetical protein